MKAPLILIVIAMPGLLLATNASSEEVSRYFEAPLPLAPLTPPLFWEDHLSTPDTPPLALPLPDTPFAAHVQRPVSEAQIAAFIAARSVPAVDTPTEPTTSVVVQGDSHWVGTNAGLYHAMGPDAAYELHPHYGTAEGPAASAITGLAVDGKNRLWVATANGLSARDRDGHWHTWRGEDGLPVHELTAVVVDDEDHLWLGSERGLIHFRPDANGRRWFYRQGRRYLPHDHVEEVYAKDELVVVKTPAGWTSIETVEHTLHDKAAYLLDRYVERHRRLGQPSPAYYDSPYALDSWIHRPQPSDGLWTSYHVTSMSLAYALTGEERYRALAREGMEALYLLQNVTGIPGLVARSVVAIDEPTVPELREQDNWHETADGKYLWRDDVSSDQLTGHFFAFYNYFEHIAKNDAEERARLEKQLRQTLDYIVENNYQIIDWDGERTMWGWWHPEMVNDAEHYLESGLYSMMILSFLKTGHYITGDEKYLDHFKKLAIEHDYLSNIQLQKKLFPDELNHSDDQLSAVTFYPFLQMEDDPIVRNVLHRALRRHALVEKRERNSLLTMVYAALDPKDADIEGALRTLREMPLDRRNWRQENSHRADVVLQLRDNRQGDELTREVLPADERHFERWNADPYEADGGGDGTVEGAGVHWMLPYWMARYHGILTGH